MIGLAIFAVVLLTVVMVVALFVGIVLVFELEDVIREWFLRKLRRKEEEDGRFSQSEKPYRPTEEEDNADN